MALSIGLREGKIYKITLGDFWKSPKIKDKSDVPLISYGSSSTQLGVEYTF